MSYIFIIPSEKFEMFFQGEYFMSLITWNKDYSVNVMEVDRQHQTLIQMINDLADAMGAGKGKEAVGKTIDSLLNYTKTHFSWEEQRFDQFGYPEAEDHKKLHAAFVDRINKFKDKYQNGKLTLSIDLMDFLSDWLRSHIQTIDKKYGPFFNQKGLQ
jgi:hemerythrin